MSTADKPLQATVAYNHELAQFFSAESTKDNEPRLTFVYVVTYQQNVGCGKRREWVDQVKVCTTEKIAEHVADQYRHSLAYRKVAVTASLVHAAAA